MGVGGTRKTLTSHAVHYMVNGLTLMLAAQPCSTMKTWAPSTDSRVMVYFNSSDVRQGPGKAAYYTKLTQTTLQWVYIKTWNTLLGLQNFIRYGRCSTLESQVLWSTPCWQVTEGLGCSSWNSRDTTWNTKFSPHSSRVADWNVKATVNSSYFIYSYSAWHFYDISLKKKKKERETQRTCGTVTLPVRAPACTSMSQAYSSVSLPAGKPSAENIAWARICRPERLRCPSHNTPSTAGRYTIKRSQNGRND